MVLVNYSLDYNSISTLDLNTLLMVKDLILKCILFIKLNLLMEEYIMLL